MAQAEALTKLPEKAEVDAVVELKVDEKALVARIENRARRDCRRWRQPVRKDDDNPEIYSRWP